VDFKTFTTPDGRKIKAALVQAPGDIDISGVVASPGQWVVEEEKLNKGVAVNTHYVIDWPDPTWEGYVAPPNLSDATDEETRRRKLSDDLGARTEAELIDLAGLYGVDGVVDGVPLKTGLVLNLVDHLLGGGEAAEPGAVHNRAPDTAVVEPVDVEAIVNPEGAGVHVPEPEDDGDDDRPAGNASTEDWYAYRLAHGYTEAKLEGLGRDELRDLKDR
jgi:hypothetical protein